MPELPQKAGIQGGLRGTQVYTAKMLTNCDALIYWSKVKLQSLFSCSLQGILTQDYLLNERVKTTAPVLYCTLLRKQLIIITSIYTTNGNIIMNYLSFIITNIISYAINTAIIGYTNSTHFGNISCRDNSISQIMGFGGDCSDYQSLQIHIGQEEKMRKA